MIHLVKNIKPSCLVLLILPLIISACTFGEKHKESTSVTEQSEEKTSKSLNPIEVLKKELNSEPVYTLLLYNIDLIEGEYKHRYKIITEGTEQQPRQSLSDWYTVSEDFFAEHAADLGMEILHKSKSGIVYSHTTPPGYSMYVGNTDYGEWMPGAVEDKIWTFNQDNYSIAEIFSLKAPITRSEFEVYQNKFRGKRSYYGPEKDGIFAFGTFGYQNLSSEALSLKEKNNKLHEQLKNFIEKKDSRFNRFLEAKKEKGKIKKTFKAGSKKVKLNYELKASKRNKPLRSASKKLKNE